MAPRAKFNRKAEAWFLAQIDKISDANPTAASNLIDRMDEVRALAAEWPRAWKRGKVPNTRHITMPPFALTIRRKNGEVEIVAIRHGRQKDAYEPSNLRGSAKPSPEQIRKMVLARKIVRYADLLGNTLPIGPEDATEYLVDLATEDELAAAVADLSNMDDFVEFLRQHNIYYTTSGHGR